MPTRLMRLTTALLIGVSCLTGSCSMATERNPGAGGPPLAYRLDEVSIHLTRQPGHGFPIRRVSLSGTGSATLERDKQNLPFRYESRELLALLNEFYRVRFFDLPTNYRARYSVFLKDDGTVGTEVLKMSDASSTSICFAVPSYEKCVTYSTEGPAELEKLAQRVFSEAEQLVIPKK